MTNENLFEKNGLYPVVTNSSTNNGVTGYTNLLPTEKGNMITYSDTTTSDGIFYQPTDYVGYSHIQGLYPLIYKEKWKYKSLMYIVTCFRKVASGRFDYGNKFNRNIAKEMLIQLPTKDGEIDFEFMDAYISELEEERISELEEERISELSAYLTGSGLDNYELSSEEKEALEIYNDMVFDEYKFKDIFNNIKQGRRLKKDDQIIGNIPFVMSGRTNTGVVGYISNPIALFSKNSITIDIFGNSFYRNYDFGAGDDTGIYWNSEVQYPKETMLYFTTAMEKALFGKYSYGKKLRSSQSFNFKMQLPTKNNEIDFTYMELLISAVKKLVIKDVVLYADNKINATKKVISKN